VKTLILSVFVVVCLSCGAPGPDDTRCLRGTLESDLQKAGALSGPEVDPATGLLKPGSYLLSSTYLKLTTDPKGQKVFRASLQELNGVLATTPGLAAFQLATSEECLTARTLSVWKDEAAMYRFVAADAHAHAVAQISEMSRGGGVVTHWADTEAGATFEKAAVQISAAVGPFF
jgi:heme-degrading monooxygenase HmoA